MTHVLLPAGLLVRRGHAVELIGRTLELAALATPSRRIVDVLDVARSTVRGWVDRFRGRAMWLRAHFTSWLLWLTPSASRIEATDEGPLSDAVAAIVAAGRAAAATLPVEGVWAFASAATGGRLLANTSAPFPAPWTA